ncbi:DUF924 domain-containing protein [Oculatella sp. LEGE 06141]|uniref:DUF924 family protein n=1 Tax=Oculatella sp. LEGE 06141 TaxID=1828648 RepID=UPI0018808EA1|nr:DUF924 family protein [Oculatella sp. LEGE 06141]MBE9178853.1 DUF924 domain-containing protein [Oculatella sp. LEGE 06141]
MLHSDTIAEILTFWFGDPQSEERSYNHRRKLWFGKNPEFDQTIRDRFLETYTQAAAAEFNDWTETPSGCLALILLLDQFPRNLFRGTPQAFATDPHALATAQDAIARRVDQALEPLQRIFVYLPFEHSENLEHQQQSVALAQQLQAVAPELTDILDYAYRHQAVIERFGRFPHRNSILGRDSTPAEIEFLKQPGSSF